MNKIKKIYNEQILYAKYNASINSVSMKIEIVSISLCNVLEISYVYQKVWFFLEHFCQAKLIIHFWLMAAGAVCCRTQIMIYLVIRDHECSHQPSTNMRVYYTYINVHILTINFYCIIFFIAFDNWKVSIICRFAYFFFNSVNAYEYMSTDVQVFMDQFFVECCGMF